ncbi:Zn-ribbon domain-containing OB-fold protein [Paraburkholderia unamae]|uniref:OB-fold protein n=1 Tax=Paraburkholderia unamae TaxID=219649 RepID=A0ABX5KFF1_9BURK|nr:OB-fold domain-containing protein [Paraburkholderia unamae]PVX77109.1 hypothetical protein C7402_115168 [Paraburkholderia unamae]
MQEELVSRSDGALAHVEGLRHGVLRFQRCTSCARAQTLARYACSGCGKSTLVWEDSNAQGNVVATTTVTRAPSEAFAALAPYVLVIVELDEGARVMGHGAKGLRIGDRVAATYFAHGERTLLRFVALEG